jgi:hypothetical protein
MEKTSCYRLHELSYTIKVFNVLFNHLQYLFCTLCLKSVRTVEKNSLNFEALNIKSIEVIHSNNQSHQLGLLVLHRIDMELPNRSKGNISRIIFLLLIF